MDPAEMTSRRGKGLDTSLPCPPIPRRYPVGSPHAIALAALTVVLGLGIPASLLPATAPPGADEPKTEVKVGKLGQLKGTKGKAKSTPPTSADIVLGSLTIRESHKSAWYAKPLNETLNNLPEQRSNYVIGNFSGKPDQKAKLKSLVEKAGAYPLGEISNGIVVSASRDAITEIVKARQPGVVDLVVPIKPQDKLSRVLRQRVAALESQGAPGKVKPPAERKKGREETIPVPPGERSSASERGGDRAPASFPLPRGEAVQADVIFYLYGASSTDRTITAIKRVGGHVLGSGRDKHLSMVRARLPLAKLTEVAAVPEVHEVVSDAKPVRRNDAAKKVMLRNPPPIRLPYQGQGQVIGHADSGLDNGVNDQKLHPAFRGRLKKTFALGRQLTGDWSDFDGHGTHTAGSLLGAGPYSGFASQAQLVHQSVGDNLGGLDGIPTPLSLLFEKAYAEGARIHSNSWGIDITEHRDLAGEYLRGREVDSWVWNGGKPRDMLIVIAAGNDGLVGDGSVGSPATAKNCLAVGACENKRPEAGSLAADPAQIAFFSSRGPAKQGRTRPDVVAPGTWVVSAKTQGERVVWQDDVETSNGWQADPAFSLPKGVALAGSYSWHLQRGAGEKYTDFLISPSLTLPAGPDLFLEVWVRGRVDPAKAFRIGTRVGNSNPQPLEGTETSVGPKRFDDWTILRGRIHRDALGKANVRLLFVALQATESTGPIDLYIDRLRITTFSSWGSLSTLRLAPPLSCLDRQYTFDGGTSMATPLVAGAAAVVRESLVKRGHANPSAELVKGILINTASDHSGHRPNNTAGWGLVNVRKAVQSSFDFDDGTSLANGEAMDYKIRVAEGDSDLRATLVWADPPSEQLVNNLDLKLVSPDGVAWHPTDAHGVSPDTTNNVEGIDVPNPPKAGEWTLEVAATRLRQGSQRYALVISRQAKSGGK